MLFPRSTFVNSTHNGELSPPNPLSPRPGLMVELLEARAAERSDPSFPCTFLPYVLFLCRTNALRCRVRHQRRARQASSAPPPRAASAARSHSCERGTFDRYFFLHDTIVFCSNKIFMLFPRSTFVNSTHNGELSPPNPLSPRPGLMVVACRIDADMAPCGRTRVWQVAKYQCEFTCKTEKGVGSK